MNDETKKELEIELSKDLEIFLFTDEIQKVVPMIFNRFKPIEAEAEQRGSAAALNQVAQHIYSRRYCVGDNSEHPHYTSACTCGWEGTSKLSLEAQWSDHIRALDLSGCVEKIREQVREEVRKMMPCGHIKAYWREGYSAVHKKGDIPDTSKNILAHCQMCTANGVIDALEGELADLRAKLAAAERRQAETDGEIERTRVQLAGCGVAALGLAKDALRDALAALFRLTPHQPALRRVMKKPPPVTPHEPLLKLNGKLIKGLKRCKHCFLSETYWGRWPDCIAPRRPVAEGR